MIQDSRPDPFFVQNRIEVVPHMVGGVSDLACCFMFYDYSRPYSPSWLKMSDAIFAEFAVEPDLAVGEFGDRHSKGNYRRVKKKLSNFLKAEDTGVEPDIRIDSAWNSADESFFPCDIRVAFSTTSYGLKNGVIAIKKSLVGSLAELVDRVSDLVFEQTGAAYGHAFDFPAAYGPDYYLSAIGAVPHGHSTLENRAYSERITRWRDNTWHLGLLPSKGYLREVYPVNFLLKTHLERKFNGRMFLEYMESVGNLTQVINRKGVYRWDVREDKLFSIRDELESSGLILSAEINKKGSG